MELIGFCSLISQHKICIGKVFVLLLIVREIRDKEFFAVELRVHHLANAAEFIGHRLTFALDFPAQLRLAFDLMINDHRQG